MKILFRALLALTLAWTASAATTSNDDSCDISVAPAATLLLPYFEVDLDDTFGETTIFTITNVTNVDRIARVTLWTDYAFPVVTFNIYLTGYDVQSINLFDVIARGIVAPDAGTGTLVAHRGAYSERNRSLDLSTCGQLPGALPEAYVTRVRLAFIEGVVPDLGNVAGCNNVGNEHANAVGYATVDVVRNCATNNHMSEKYWTEDLAWDNVLIGDYHQVDPSDNNAQGAPMVHIRAVPEGGTSAERLALPRKHDAGFSRTFYARFQRAHAPKLDGRQPLPFVFAARWIQGGASGFQTFLKIWREGATPGARTCATWDDNYQYYIEIVSFDEAENAVADVPIARITPITTEFMLPPTSLTSVTDDDRFPQHANGAIGGWMYLNLDPFTWDGSTSNWVISSMRAERRFSVDIEAAALGNGCSPKVPRSEVSTGNAIIGPLPNGNP